MICRSQMQLLQSDARPRAGIKPTAVHPPMLESTREFKLARRRELLVGHHVAGNNRRRLSETRCLGFSSIRLSVVVLVSCRRWLRLSCWAREMLRRSNTFLVGLESLRCEPLGVCRNTRQLGGRLCPTTSASGFRSGLDYFEQLSLGQAKTSSFRGD